MKLDFTKTNHLLKKELNAMQPYDIADLLVDLEEEEQERVATLIGAKKMAIVFSRLSKYQQRLIFDVLKQPLQKEILKFLEIDELKEFINYFPEQEQDEVFNLISVERANLIKDLLIYSNDTAPSIMSTEFMTINIEMSIKQATYFIFTNVKDNDFIDHIYVVDRDEKLLGAIALRDLIIARPSDTIKGLITKELIFAYNDYSIKETIDIVRNYDISAVPVIDHSGYLLGIITADDVLEQLITQYDEAYRKLAYIKSHDESFSGFRRSIVRLPWLIIATILNLVIAFILASVPAFEATVSTIITLVLFQPMILDMAGNIGTQNLAVVILELHRDELDTKKKTKQFIRKEVVVSLLNSLTIAVIGFTMAVIFTMINQHHSAAGIPINYFKMGIVVGLSLFIGMGLSGILGTYIPIFLTKINADTDNASGPILTTLNDIISLFTYYGIAALLLMAL